TVDELSPATATSVAVGQDMVEGHASPLAHASQKSSGSRSERSRLERLPRIAIAHVAGPGDQARLEDPPPKQHDLTLLPGQRVAPWDSRRPGPLTRLPLPRAEAPPARGGARRRMRGRCACRWTAVRVLEGSTSIIESWTVACPGCVRLARAAARSQRAGPREP